jgi:hypothetical protein
MHVALLGCFFASSELLDSMDTYSVANDCDYSTAARASSRAHTIGVIMRIIMVIQVLTKYVTTERHIDVLSV